MKKHRHGKSEDIITQIVEKYVVEKSFPLESSTLKAEHRILFYRPTREEAEILQSKNLQSIHISGKIRVQNILNFKGGVIKSMLHKTHTTIDYMVKMCDESIKAIRYFIPRNNRIYVVTETVLVNASYTHMTEISLTGNIEVHKIEHIAEKLLAFEINKKMLVSRAPNKYESL